MTRLRKNGFAPVRMIRFARREEPTRFVRWSVCLFFEALLVPLTIWLLKLVVNRFRGAFEGTRGMEDAFVMLGLLALGLIGLELLRNLRQISWQDLQIRLTDILMGRVQEVAGRVDLAYFDDPEFHRTYFRAHFESPRQSVELLSETGTLLRHAVVMSIIFLLMTTVAWWLPFAFLAAMLPGIASLGAVSRMYKRWHHESTGDRQEAEYLHLMQSLREPAAEMRALELYPPFARKYAELRATLRDGRLRIERIRLVTLSAAFFVALLVVGLVTYWAIEKVREGGMDVGTFVMLAALLYQSQSSMRQGLQLTGKYMMNTIHADDLFRHLGQDSILNVSDTPAKPGPLTEGIRFRGVTFAYPGSEHPVLDNFSAFIPAGRRTALMGPNGAGKSTVLRLLCRFYDPQEGQILWDGTDLRAFEPATLRRAMTILFQQPLQVEAPVSENLRYGCGDVAKVDILKAVANAGATEIIEGLPSGLDTLLGRRIHDGVELSVGEWQRIALARTTLRDASFVLLDEPTSAMDPWAELLWQDRCKQATAGRTLLVITHRTRTAEFAEHVIVMNDGRVEEEGTPAELRASGGFSSEIW